MRHSSETTPAEMAAHWHDLAVANPACEDTQRQLREWLDRSPDHAAAYDAAAHAWRFARTQGEHPRILALRHETALRLIRSPRAPAMRRRWMAAAAVVLLGVAVGTLLWTRETEALRLLTQTGERLTSRLPDGTQVTLNTRTELETHFTASERRVDVTRGQAFFEVAPDKNRPFAVHAGGRRFVALGTSFDVRVDAGRVQITMVDGAVRVERSASQARGAAIETIATLTAGQQLTFESRHQDRIRPADSSNVTSWRAGQVIFEDMRLSQAIDELNRYSDVALRLENPDLADLRVSGAFATGNPDLFVEALTRYFPIEVKRADRREILLGPRANN